jgi:hypothetical protein
MDGAPVSGAVVWLVAGPSGDGRDVAPAAAALTGPDGGFRFDRVRARARPYSVVAFLDANGDAEFDADAETGALVDGAALVGVPGDSLGGITVTLSPPGAGEGAEE